MCFDPLSIAFHPGGGEVSVCASQVSGGFVAFAFPPTFREDTFGDDATVGGVTRSVENILSPTVTSLVSYARTAMLGNGCFEALCIESLGYLAYSEAICGMRALRERTSHRALSKRALDRLLAYIEDNIAEPLTIAELAKIVALPIATLRRHFLQLTGQSLHQVIIERRLQHACNLLLKTDSAISDVSAASGFSSQQHVTTTFRNRLGATPRAFRRANGNEKLAYNESAQAFFEWNPALGEYSHLVLVAIWDQRSQDHSASSEYGRFIVPPGRMMTM
jgi:AraC-like DNA-binding protein